MSNKQKNIWSELQDQLLKKFYQQQQIRNWSLIAKKMTQQYNTHKKSGKQCKQRYQNHIDSSIIKIQWTTQQQKQLIRLHNQIGNKWANIAIRLPGKSDNCVKNHFYSKLRKVLRKLNKIIHYYFRRQLRQININVIYKIVEATQQRFKQHSNCSEQTSIKCQNIQNRMLSVVLGNQQEDNLDQEENIQFYKDMIKQIYSASKQYKRKSKKSRNQSIQAPNLKSKIQSNFKNKNKQKQKTILVQTKAPSDGYMSDSSNSNNQDDSQFQDEKFHKATNPPHTFIVNQDQKPINNFDSDKKIQIQEGKQRIQNMLRQNNILQNQNSSGRDNQNYFKFSDRSSFKSFNSDRQSDKDFFNMFQASDLEVGGRRKNSKYLYFCQKADDNNYVNFSQKQ